jgi:ATP-dependent exoDNAse (exonuclease V) beta subunit
VDLRGKRNRSRREYIRRGSDRIAWSGGIRQIRLLEADEGKVVSTRGREKWDRWYAQRSALIETGKTPTIVVNTATELSIAAPSKDGVAEIEVIETQRDSKRPHGTLFGTLVHRAMLRVSLEASDRDILAAVSSEGRMLGADDGEIAAAARAVSLALKSPLMARVRCSREVRRECPVLLTLDDGAIVEGIADLAFAEGANGATIWNVVDFKTDLAIKSRLDEYRAQIALYARGISRAIDLPARGILFWI